MNNKLSMFLRTMFVHYAALITIAGIVMAKSVDQPPEQLVCEFYNPDDCDPAKEECSSTEVCEHEVDLTHGKATHCYALFTNATHPKVLKKGCWLDNPQCYEEEAGRCVGRSMEHNDMIYCCCNGPLCNKNITFIPDPKPTVLSTTSNSMTVETYSGREDLVPILAYTITPIVGLFIVSIIVFYLWRRHIALYREALPQHEPEDSLPPIGQSEALAPIRLMEVKARGRFGAVWKAQLNNEYVAVKIFPVQDKASWCVETDIYRLAGMQHQNVLAFLGSQRQGDNLNSELWLVSEFHEKGSLYDYIKGNTITWSECCIMSESMASGLAFLHEDVPGKPAIAHRDFKSKNVLLKNDMTTCVADLGLALIFEPGKNPGDVHGQVGTRRYMAPEVLEGAINFNRDAFLRIDMYACGLVLWEMLSRCTTNDVALGDYQLPFSDEIGQHPALEDMQECVVHNKTRPKLQPHWYTKPAMAQYCDTIEDCWDHDAEARLTAKCVEERIALLSKTTNTSSDIMEDSGIVRSTSSQSLLGDDKEEVTVTV